MQPRRRRSGDPVRLQRGAARRLRGGKAGQDADGHARQWHRQRGISVGIERADAVAMSSWRAMLCPPRAG
jgi:hypothetical protein